MSYTGSVNVMLRVTVDSKVSDWSKLKVKIVLNTKLLSQSGDTTLCAGQPIKLHVGAEGYNLDYKWYKNNNLVQSGASGQMSISGTSTFDSGDYFSKISGFCEQYFPKI